MASIAAAEVGRVGIRAGIGVFQALVVRYQRPRTQRGIARFRFGTLLRQSCGAEARVPVAGRVDAVACGMTQMLAAVTVSVNRNVHRGAPLHRFAATAS